LHDWKGFYQKSWPLNKSLWGETRCLGESKDGWQDKSRMPHRPRLLAEFVGVRDGIIRPGVLFATVARVPESSGRAEGHMHRILFALAVVVLAAVPACGGLDESSADPQSPADSPAGEPVDEALQEIGGFSAASFPFKTTIQDDGTDVGGGYQEAKTTLKFTDPRQRPIARWTCSFTVGMPLRTAKYGKIDAIHAAVITAQVATLASKVIHTRSAWLPVLFCKEFKEKMTYIFHKSA
jgi:hypothetical protein